MKYLAKSIFLFLVIFLMTGCAKVLINSDSDPNVDLAALDTFYVQKFAPDKRGLEKIIANHLNDFGFQATSGIDAVPPYPVDALVTYKDRWMWDITNYMLEINIEFRNPESSFMFASGKSYRTSLARKSPDEMIDEVIQDLFSEKNDAAK